MANQTTRSRMRVDLPCELIRAARGKAGFEGKDVNDVIAEALTKHLAAELANMATKENHENTEQAPSPQTN